MRIHTALFFVLALFIVSCSTARKAKKTTNAGIGRLKFINEYIVPNGIALDSTVIGGLSGIDYDPQRDVYYMICDDPSTFGAARFYTVKIPISANGIDSIRFTGVTIIRNREGNPYADIRKDRLKSVDLEAMRYDPTRNEMIRSSEGQRFITSDTAILQDPDIIVMNTNGTYKDSFQLPSNLHVQATENGPRHNSLLEGLSFSSDYRSVYVSVEDALYDDGPKAGTGDSTAWVRILQFDRESRKQVAQYAYKVDAVPYPANPPGAFKLNGISDILYVGNKQLIVIERAWSTGRVPSDVRIYLADMKNAADISGVHSLLQNPPGRPITKKLLLDMSTLNRTIYNIEGVTFGPTLSNGHRSMLFVVDNNFNKNEKSQFLLFEVVPE